MLITYTGREFDFQNITKESIHIPDIIHSLPSLTRFLGHSIRPYSVGEHLVNGLLITEKLGFTPLQKLHWLIHDFTEAYVGDCPTPLKRLIPEYAEIEAKVESAILEHLGLGELTDEEYKLVKAVDATMLVIEMRDLTLHDYTQFVYDNVYLDIIEDTNFDLNPDEARNREVISRILEAEFNNLIKEVNKCKE